MGKRIAVLGAGICGLTTALSFIDRGFDVTIYTTESVSKTTSNTAAAFWYPFWTGSEPDHSWYERRWAEFTYRKYVGEYFDNAPGVGPIKLIEYFDNTLSEFELAAILKGMWWKDIPEANFTKLDQDKIPENLQKIGIDNGIQFDTLVVNMHHYLRYLEEQYNNSKLGGKLLIRKIEESDLLRASLGFIAETQFDLIVNCTGLGSFDLFGDNGLEGREGIVIRAPNTINEDHITLLHTGQYDETPIYIVPRPQPENDIVFGGSIKPVSEKITLTVEQPYENNSYKTITDRIMGMCEQIVPAVSTITPTTTLRALRPARLPKVRLEYETPNLAHNYGHAGGGMTLAWGCANWLTENYTG